MKYRTIYDRILVKRDPETENESTIFLPNDVKKLPRTGIVLCVGPEAKYLKDGDRVTFNEYAGYFVQITQDLAESDLISMREDEVTSVIEEDS